MTSRTLPIAGTSLELIERGAGRPLLFLHAGEGLDPQRPWFERLARHYRVIAPWHPGWGNSPLIDGNCLVDDLAYLSASTALLCCCGAPRTGSSRPPTARNGASRSRTPGSN